MKRKILLCLAICTLLLVLIPACNASEAGSIKTITRPYIAQYECTKATFGEDDILSRFDYIKIILEDKETMQLLYKLKNGERTSIESEYQFNTETHELTAEIGILGYKFKQTTVIENGKFTISKAIGTKQLVMNFEAE